MSTKQARIYDFDPAQLAATETAMWRAYYDRQVLALFRLGVRLLQEQLAFEWPLALLNGYRLTIAAFVFKRGKQREDYRRALRWLRPFYHNAQRRLAGQWNPDKVAEYELEWWIIHRHEFGPGQTNKLEQALAALCSLVYHVPVEELGEYARYRAEAMLISDAINQAREKGQPMLPRWAEIQQNLQTSYAALRARLNQKAS